MRRHRLAPRPDWRDKARLLGFAFAEIAGEPYWDETACWELTAAEVETLESATAELERLAREAAGHAVRHRRQELLGIPDSVWPLLVESWERQEPSLYGRMDLRWDGTGAPKLLEYNADTPTSLYESAVVQWEWLTCACPDADQFNSLHEALIAAWPGLRLPPRVHFVCVRESEEDRGTVDYLRDTATQAGIEAPFLYMDDIGWDGRRFVDLEGRTLDACFKLYPWEFLLRDAFGNNVATAPTRWIEPAWRLLLSGKGLLALLWELFPDHPNLLPAFREPGRTGGAEIAKPLFGREGANISAPGGLRTDGPYGAEGHVYQQWAELPQADGRYAVVGSWVIAGVPHGIGIREDATPITRDTSRFVPHFFRGTA
ncbi:MAG: glutathionylspermidine synthase family protein [Acetobacteraceae bacterium]